MDGYKNIKINGNTKLWVLSMAFPFSPLCIPHSMINRRSVYWVYFFSSFLKWDVIHIWGNFNFNYDHWILTSSLFLLINQDYLRGLLDKEAHSFFYKTNIFWYIHTFYYVSYCKSSGTGLPQNYVLLWSQRLGADQNEKLWYFAAILSKWVKNLYLAHF